MKTDAELYDIIITGAGPAGLFCAINCCGNKSSRILVLEKMPTAGRKLLISGSGSCNITHSGSIKDFEGKYGRHGQFIRHALSAFTNTDMVNFLNSNGIKTVEMENGKIFPESMKAREILDLLLHLCRKNGVEILYNHGVQDIQYSDNRFRVRADDPAELFESRFCVITTGGSSYPLTGSSGDGYKLAEKFGHEIVPATPALTPVTALTPETSLPPELSGITLQNASITLVREGRQIICSTGDLLFTRTGLSGPVILDMSRYLMPGDKFRISFSRLDYKTLENSFIKISREEGKRGIKTIVRQFGVPERLVQTLLDRLEIQTDKRSSEISKHERKKIVSAMTEFPVTVKSKGDFSVAMATAGGVSLAGINKRTMESKIAPGLFFAGEVLDIDGDTGGYNLQAAFSTGKLAADSIISRLLK